MTITLSTCRRVGETALEASVFGFGAAHLGEIYVKLDEAACAAHGASLQAAALQFPLAHPALVSVIPGTAKPSEITQNIASLQASIPAVFCSELKTKGLIDKDAPTPGLGR